MRVSISNELAREIRNEFSMPTLQCIIHTHPAERTFFSRANLIESKGFPFFCPAVLCCSVLKKREKRNLFYPLWLYVMYFVIPGWSSQVYRALLRYIDDLLGTSTTTSWLYFWVGTYTYVERTHTHAGGKKSKIYTGQQQRICQRSRHTSPFLTLISWRLWSSAGSIRQPPPEWWWWFSTAAAALYRQAHVRHETFWRAERHDKPTPRLHQAHYYLHMLWISRIKLT